MSDSDRTKAGNDGVDALGGSGEAAGGASGALFKAMTELESQLQLLRVAHSQVERDRVESAERQRQLREREEAIESRAQLLEEKVVELNERAQEVRGDLETARSERSIAEQSLRTLDEQRAKLDEVKRRTDEQAADVEERAAALKELAERVSTERAELDRRTQEAAATAERVRELTARIESAEAAQREQSAALSAERARAQASDERASELMARAEELSGQLDAARGELEAVTGKLRQAVEDEKTRVEEISDLRRQVRDREAEAEELRRQLELATRSTREGTKEGGQVDELIAEVRRRDAMIAELRQRCDDQASAYAHEHEQLEAMLAEIGKVRDERDRAVIESKTLKARLAAATGGGGAGGAEGAGVSGGTAANDLALEVRRQRLRRVKQALRDQAGKIRQASDVLRKRYEETESVLSQRAELAAQKQAIVSAQKRQQANVSRSRAAATVFYCLGVMSILGVLSWALTNQFVPATYVARAQVKADGLGRELTEPELAEWQRFHEEALYDPSFLQFASERMERRGVTTLSKPGDLKSRLEADMVFDSASAGSLTIELKGRGSSRTQRELSTYVAALVSHANSARDRRSDGASTTVAVEAQADTDPVSDQRVMYAAGILGGGTLVSLVLGLFVWRRLADAKTEFERDAVLGAADAPEWSGPEIGAARPIRKNAA